MSEGRPVPPARAHLLLPLPPPWMISIFVTLLVIAGVFAVDRQWSHYVWPKSEAAADPARREREATCEAAARWRDAVQEYEVTTNTVDRSLAESQQTMNDAYRVAANVSFPLIAEDRQGRELVSNMQDWNRIAEAWLAGLPALYAMMSPGSPATLQERIVRSDKSNALLLDANHVERLLNPYLAHLCGIAPLDPYKK